MHRYIGLHWFACTVTSVYIRSHAPLHRFTLVCTHRYISLHWFTWNTFFLSRQKEWVWPHHDINLFLASRPGNNIKGQFHECKWPKNWNHENSHNLIRNGSKSLILANSLFIFLLSEHFLFAALEFTEERTAKSAARADPKLNPKILIR